MKIWTLFACLAICLPSCTKPGVYVVFAQNAKTDDAMRYAITLRLPMERTPVGTTVFCESPGALVFASKLNEAKLKVHDPDGEEREVELPSDGTPVGTVTYWPNGRATRCGLSPASPIGANAYLMWGEFTMFFTRTGQNSLRYTVSDDSFQLNYPLTENDRATLRKHAVPHEVASLLY